MNIFKYFDLFFAIVLMPILIGLFKKYFKIKKTNCCKEVITISEFLILFFTSTFLARIINIIKLFFCYNLFYLNVGDILAAFFLFFLAYNHIEDNKNFFNNPKTSLYHKLFLIIVIIILFQINYKIYEELYRFIFMSFFLLLAIIFGNKNLIYTKISRTILIEIYVLFFCVFIGAIFYILFYMFGIKEEIFYFSLLFINFLMVINLGLFTYFFIKKL